MSALGTVSLLYGVDVDAKTAARIHSAVAQKLSEQNAPAFDVRQSAQSVLGWTGFQMRGHGADEIMNDPLWHDSMLNNGILAYSVGFEVSGNLVANLAAGPSALIQRLWSAEIGPMLAELGVSTLPDFVSSHWDE